MSFIELPPATPRPCSECPWRRKSLPGYLGPFGPEKWIEIIHSEAPIACHLTLRGTRGKTAEEIYAMPTVRQCAGAAIYRNNVLKSSRNPTAADHVFEEDPKTVFARDIEFIAHHTTRTHPHRRS